MNSSKLTESFAVMSKYGVPRSSAIFMATSIWSIKVTDRDIFKEYFLLHWQVEYYRAMMESGTVERNGKLYQVIYHRTNSYEVLKHTGKLHLSFRELQDEYNVFPVVLVSLDCPAVHTDKFTA